MTPHAAVYFDWLKARGLSEKTIESREKGLGRFFDFARAKDADVQTAHVEAYRRYVTGRLSRVTKRPLTPGGIYKLLSPVKAYFAWLQKRGVIVLSPAMELTWPVIRRGKLPEVPSKKEMEALLAQPSRTEPTGIRDRAILELMYSSGLRGGEVPRLDVYDVDLVDRTARIRQGKGHKDRVVPFGETARESLSLYLRTARPALLTQGRETALFLAANGARMPLRTLEKALRSYSLAALGRSVSGHKLRHAFATHMVAGGADIRRVQEMMGHAMLRTTQIYTRVKPMDLKEAHRRCHPRG